jgi:hypothetical protein
VIVVENSVRSLPAEPLDSWTRVQPMPRPVDREQRYHNYNHNEFRPIREAFSSLGEHRSTEEKPLQHSPVADTSVPAPASRELFWNTQGCRSAGNRRLIFCCRNYLQDAEDSA